MAFITKQVSSLEKIRDNGVLNCEEVHTRKALAENGFPI